MGQGAFAVDLCTTASTTVSALTPGDNCQLDLSAEALTVTAAGSVGQGVQVSVANAAIANAGLVADDYTAIYYNSLGLGGTLTNTGLIEVDSGLSWAAAVYDQGSIAGTLNNSGTINAAATAASWAAADAIYVGGESTYTSVVTNPTANETVWATDYSTIGLGSAGALINSGSISASAQANTWTAYATGLQMNGAVLGSIDNSGSISASADAGWQYAVATGVSLGGGSIGSSDSRNYSVAGATSYTYAGNDSYLGLGSAAALTNSGSITATAYANNYRPLRRAWKI